MNSAKVDKATTLNRFNVQISNLKKTHHAIGFIQVQSWNNRERITRAFLYLLAYWGAACMSLIIPVLHFILVPGLVIAGPIVAISISKQEHLVLGGEGQCPMCQHQLKIDRVAYKFPIIEVCGQCHARLSIEIIENLYP